MKRFSGIALSVAACSLASQAALAQTKLDTTKVQNLNEVVVKAVRASKDAPYAVANIKKAELQQFSRTGQELPFLLSRTPGILAWGENGLGTGTSYMRIRGAAGSRINVTLDGVALNSPEDQTVFWANMNSYAALLGSVQVQRGVGSSTNGDGAFGGSISMATAAPSLIPTAELTGSYGSYNTYNTGLSFSTGLMGKHLIFDGAYHETATDGYIDGTSGRSGSYYGGLTWLADNFKISYKNIGNFEKTGQAWSGVLGGDYDTNFTLMDDGIRTYKDMYEAGLGKFNILTAGLSRNGKGSYTVLPCVMVVVGTRLPITSTRTITSSPLLGHQVATGATTLPSTTPTDMVTTRSSRATASSLSLVSSTRMQTAIPSNFLTSCARRV